MKFTEEEIRKGLVVVFLSQSGIAHSAQEAADLINSYHLGEGILHVNPCTRKSLESIFKGEEVRGYDLRTTGCGPNGIRLFPALADTIDEHNRIYRERCDEEKRMRIAEAQAAHEKMLQEWNEEKKGWYYVKVSVTTQNMSFTGHKYLDLSAHCIADSKMDAYNKFVSQEIRNMCAERMLTLESCSQWNSMNTEVLFLGMKTDYGYSVDEWEKFQEMQKN